MINVFLVDDHELVRTGIKRLLEDVRGIKVVGEADSGENDHYTRAAYECELRGLISSYRKAFGQPQLPVIIIQLPGIKGTVGFQHDNDTAQGFPSAQGWSAIQVAQQDATAGQSGVGLVSVPDFGCCGLHYSHKFPVAERAANVTRQLVYGDKSVDLQAPRFESVSRVQGNIMSLDLHFNNTKGLMLKPTYMCNQSYSRHGWVKNVVTIQGQEYDVNATCCESTPAGHEGIGIVKMLVNTTRHPRQYVATFVISMTAAYISVTDSRDVATVTGVVGFQLRLK